MIIPSYEALRAYRESNGWPWFVSPGDLNLFVARSPVVGRWDDLVLVAFRDDGGTKVVEAFVATSDASESEWLNPEHPEGCIFILPQHVRGGYERGWHKHRPALRQRRPFSCVRWPANGTIPTVAELEARAAKGHAFMSDRGTHLHNRVSSIAPDKPRTGDSRGCIVTKYQHQHASLIALVDDQNARHGTSIISPTFCNLVDL